MATLIFLFWEPWKTNCFNVFNQKYDESDITFLSGFPFDLHFPNYNKYGNPKKLNSFWVKNCSKTDTRSYKGQAISDTSLIFRKK